MLRPSECALLLAIPATRAEFDRAWRRRSDFLAAYAGEAADPGRAWARYAPYAALSDEVAREAAESGVSVAREATLAQLTDAIGRFRVVTLAAHSRDATVRETDVANAGLVQARAPAIAAALLPHGHRDRFRVPEKTAADLAGWLNGLMDACLEQARLDAPPSGSSAAAAMQTWTELRRWDLRREIDRLAAPGLAGGAAVEFGDGFHLLEEIDAAVPGTLCECLDLTVCESVLLGEILRRRRTTGVILTNVEATSADFRMALYRQALRLVRKRGTQYQDAVLAIRAHLRQVTWTH
jgi:hypothetical protein